MEINELHDRIHALENAMRYLADRGNWEVEHDGDDTYKLKRPGAGFLLADYYVKPWDYAKDCL